MQALGDAQMHITYQTFGNISLEVFCIIQTCVETLPSLIGFIARSFWVGKSSDAYGNFYL